ncbi:dpy-30 -like protein [Brachionus plicatilis]|uniref:Dpy-30-like protein n=1 Tax=Brachionus plicatilis TaxID=10195 RepID=A0A3M7P7V5_BRAPC|nr:dpy-30 -like protein [Brachionus plicatilis]
MSESAAPAEPTSQQQNEQMNLEENAPVQTETQPAQTGEEQPPAEQKQEVAEAEQAPAQPEEPKEQTSDAVPLEETKQEATNETEASNVQSGLDQNVEKMIEQESQEAQNTKKQKVDLQSLPVRAYLDQTIVPILLQGMSVLAKERPPNPIEYLATYLLKNKDKFE